MKAFISLLSSLIYIFWGGFAIAMLWQWFAVPLGAIHITPLHGAGLSVLASSIFGSRSLFADIYAYKMMTEGERMFYPLFCAALMPFFALIAGFTIRALMSM